MCGICGIINRDHKPVQRGIIEKMNDLVEHRGPDSKGFFLWNNFALGHRRLKIIDLSESANQPMSYNSKYTITFNGEIYNYLEIRNDLVKAGYSFSTSSDTEVILAAYDHYGLSCVSKFNGMWAFALYDSVNQIMFCSRDRFGVKPFYYYHNDSVFAFGSEIKQLLIHLKKTVVNQPVLMDYLISGFEEHTNDTFFQDIHKLEQSHSLVYDLSADRFSISRYYEISIDENISRLNEKESVILFRNALQNAVRLRLRSDAKVGTCLSGGLDSSSIATLASFLYSQDNNNKFTSITAVSSEPQSDESAYARRVAQNANLDSHFILPEYDDFRTEVDKIIRIQEEPFGGPSVYMQYKVFEKARALGTIVMLDGQGGDEILLGYERYYPAFIRSSGFIDKFSRFMNSSINSGLSKKDLFLYTLYFTSPSIRINKLRKRFSLIRGEFFDKMNKETIKESALSYKNYLLLQKLELMRLQLPHLLKYEDRNSMYHSIESRLPFIDYNMVETALAINNKYKINDGWSKYILRRAAEDILPSEIAWRKVKFGFNAPEKTWLGSMNDQMLKSVSSSDILNKITTEEGLKCFENLDVRSKWRFFNIARWEEIYNVAAE